MTQEQKEQWHYLHHAGDTHDYQSVTSGVAPQHSLWFSGHFPGNPILPGIAILAMVKEAIICEEGGKGKKVKIIGVRKVRFRQPVKPDDILSISYSAIPVKKNRAYSFKVSLAEQVMCMGTMLAAEASDA